MKQLILSTTAYKTFSSDKRQNRLSHAYMLHLNDAKNLKEALKIFALEFFGLEEGEVAAKRIYNESLTDCYIYPEEGKKLTVEGISKLIADTSLQPLEMPVKLYIIHSFEQASALIQNKLLKTLEEPPAGVYFLLGATSLSPVLDTVKSRVKTLAIPPFMEEEIFLALERKGENSLNRKAAQSCGGILGAAENMVGGGWFAEISKAAEEICCANEIAEIGALAVKYGETKHKNELLMQMSLLYSGALKEHAEGGRLGRVAKIRSPRALIFALESLDRAYADVKFNAFFQGLLYDFMLRVIKENEKWSKLQA